MNTVDCQTCKFAKIEFNTRTFYDMLVCGNKNAAWYDEFVIQGTCCELYELSNDVNDEVNSFRGY